MKLLKKIVEKFFEQITALGGIVSITLILIFFLINSYYEKALVLFFGIIITYLVSIIIRLIYFKQRPQKIPYNNIVEKINASSFPSIHSARAIFLFIFLSNILTSQYNKSVLAIIALLICYSRIHLKKHFTIDVIAGAILGFFTAYLVV